MSALLKNDVSQVRKLLPYFDAALNEQCHQYHECGALERFVNAGKAVFGVEYKLKKSRVLPAVQRGELQLPEEAPGAGPVAARLPPLSGRRSLARDAIVTSYPATA